ncbi:MAG TPA: acetoacetate--CoA ligase [Thermoleophilaceae bacterium]|nr:acetoacetate--CoA ligase [Thermoleophilaceae bacterium]
MGTPRQGEVLWTPAPDARNTTVLGRYMDFVRDERGRDFAEYEDLWRWSVEDLEGFWGSVWDFFGIRAHTPPSRVLGSSEMPGAEWFPGATLNYAEHMLGTDEDTDRVALVSHSQTRGRRELTFGELRDLVARVRAGLVRLGVQRGDRVVAYMPNIPETLAAMLATTSLGAVWASCAPEFGARSVVSRFGQIEPKVLLAISGYKYGDKRVDRRPEVAELRSQLPTLEHVIEVPYGEGSLPDALSWDSLVSEPGPLEFEPVPFSHPIYVLFSSGTTGLPKAIVHCHGGILIEHLKNLGLSWDMGPEDRIFWFSTTAWMIWNALMSGLLCRSSVVMIDGNPLYPDLREQWRIIEAEQATIMGMAPAYAMSCRKQGIEPLREFDLSRVKQIEVAGSPMPTEGFGWIYESVTRDAMLNVGSGGTDVCSGYVAGMPLQPVYAGEMTGCLLGVDAAAFDANGRPVVGELGEMVIRKPMPSMPVGFWNDPGDERYRGTYFDMYPGVWRQGDWIMFTERGSCVITGRSDATLNRGGVRLGTGELYGVIEEIPEIVDSLIVHLEDREGGAGELVLFVQLQEGMELDDSLRGSIARSLRAALSPRHVPDTIEAVSSVPRTLTGKKLELPVKRILQGANRDDVVRRDSLADPTSIDAYVEYALSRTPA